MMKDKDEWQRCLSSAAKVCVGLHPTIVDATKGPGEAVLVCLIMAQGIIKTAGDLPSLTEYVAAMEEIGAAFVVYERMQKAGTH